mmetsp:Transcript_23976/g.44044  ORF Transcript_23976/g.44044 Transcript_23976/m.44044 type:complete len:211 (+) Transcript_23976:782-1414(+)
MICFLPNNKTPLPGPIIPVFSRAGNFGKAHTAQIFEALHCFPEVSLRAFWESVRCPVGEFQILCLQVHLHDRIVTGLGVQCPRSTALLPRDAPLVHISLRLRSRLNQHKASLAALKVRLIILSTDVLLKHDGFDILLLHICRGQHHIRRVAINQSKIDGGFDVALWCPSWSCCQVRWQESLERCDGPPSTTISCSCSASTLGVVDQGKDV